MFISPSLSNLTDVCTCAAAGILAWTFGLAWRSSTAGWSIFFFWSAGFLVEAINVVASLGTTSNKGPEFIETVCSVIGSQIVLSGWVTLAILFASGIWTIRNMLKPVTAPKHALRYWTAASVIVPTAPFFMRPLANILGVVP